MMRRAPWTLACGVILIAGLTLVSTRALALVLVPEGNPGLLSLWTDSYPLQYSDMAPGDVAYMPLTVVLDDTDRGDLSLEIRKEGDLAEVPGGLELQVERCGESWTSVPTGISTGGTPLCGGGWASLLSADSGDDYSGASPTWDLGEIETGTAVFLLVRLALPSTTDPAAIDGLSASFGFGLYAEGESASAPLVPTGLALTGVDALSLVLIAVGAIGIGVTVRRAHRAEVDR